MPVSAEVAAAICGCSLGEVDRYRRTVLPRQARGDVDLALFTATEVVAIAAGTVMEKWRHRSASVVARLALSPPDDRAWVIVYQPRKGIRVEPTPFALVVRRQQGARIFDPAPYYEAFDEAEARSSERPG